jgi:7-carboxy-7-deazaguanine synthase
LGLSSFLGWLKQVASGTSTFMRFLVSEIFHSIQGEGTLTGVPFVFVRLSGCNLRCTYCDTSYAFKGGTFFSLQELIAKIESYRCKQVLLTGGEPLMQRGTPELTQRLAELGFLVSIETHGEADISQVTPFARIILDIKTPGSKMQRGGYKKNLPLLKPTDEVKFVITSSEDYAWARDLIRQETWPTPHLLLSLANAAKNSPGAFQGPTDSIDLKWLAEKILADALNVRLQVQLHKLIWGAEQRGV